MTSPIFLSDEKRENIRAQEQKENAIQQALYTEYENMKKAAEQLFKALTQKEIPTRPESNVFGDGTLENYLESTKERSRNFLYELEQFGGNEIDNLYNTIAYTYQAMNETLTMIEIISRNREIVDR